MTNWIDYYKSIGLKDELISRYNSYIENLEKRDLPVIYEFNHLAQLLGVDKNYLNSIIYGTDCFYREFRLEKKSKGFRVISVPYPSLLLIQKWIHENILRNVKIHKCAHGFAHKKSIVSNCLVHVGKPQVLKIDLTDFFPSINFNRVIKLFHSLGYTKRVSFYLARLCTNKEQLTQGAPTSPMLSNIICKKLDKRLFALSQKFDLNYTRYADDLVFSGKHIPLKFLEYIQVIINSEGFQVNKEKTRLYRNNNKKIITGIVVKNDKLGIPREYKRNLKQELNFIMKYGLDSHLRKRKIRSLNYLQILIGKVNFWLTVENKNEYAKKTLISGV